MSKKRVIFCTYSSIYSSKVLEPLIADDNIDVVAIVNSTRVINSDYGFFRGALWQIKNSGWRYATYLFVITDVFRIFQPIFKFKVWPLKTVHGLARQHNIPLLDTADINNPEAVQFIQQATPNYLLAAHFNQLVKQALLNNPEIECINIHPSLLPAYKGVDPVFFALLDKKKEIGVTLHKMAETFDSGEILLQESVGLSAIKTLCFYNCQLFEEGVKLALAWMNNEQEKLMEIGDNNFGQYDSWPTLEQIKRFRRSGYQLIDLSELWKQH